MRLASPPRLAFLLSILFLGVAASGCVSDGAQDEPTDPIAGDVTWAERAIPFGDGHDHADPAQHQGLSTPNFELLGWDPLVTDALGRSAGGYYCGEVATTDEGRRLAVVNSFTTGVAFVVADVTDPAAPFLVGEYLLDNVHVYDSAVTDDGKYVILGGNPETNPSPPADLLQVVDGVTSLVVQPKWRDACTGEVRAAGPEQYLPLAPAVILVDISTPEEPAFADFQPTPVLGPHSVHAATVDGTRYAVASITNLQHQSSYFTFYEVADTLLGGKLVTLSTYQAPPGPESSVPLINGHVDATIQKHPVTGQTLAYLANWDGGMVVLDISQPRAPMRIATWGGAQNGPASLGDSAHGAIHSTLPIDGLWNGRHYTIVGQELGGRPADRPTGWIFIVDTTDPANPVEAGRWTLPVDVTWSAFLQFSTHYTAIVERTMFVALYHGGVWAVDLSTDAAIAEPPTIGVFVPDRISPSPAQTSDADEVLDVLAFPNGDLAVYASNSGVYMVRFDASSPMAAPTPWQRE